MNPPPPTCQITLRVAKVFNPTTPGTTPVALIKKSSIRPRRLRHVIIALFQVPPPPGEILAPGEIAIAYHFWTSNTYGVIPVPALTGPNIRFCYEMTAGRLVYKPDVRFYQPDTSRAVTYDSVKHCLVFYQGRLAYCKSKNGNHGRQVTVIWFDQDGYRHPGTKKSPSINSLRYAVPIVNLNMNLAG